MYLLIILILLGSAGALIYKGIKAKQTLLSIIGGVLALFTVVLFSILDIWGEILWFDAIGYNQRIWIEITTKFGLGIACAVIGWLILHLLTISIPDSRRVIKYFARLVGTVGGFIWGLSNWSLFLIFNNRVSTSITDPIIGKETGFYLFILPFLDSLFILLIFVLLIALLAKLSALYLNVASENTPLKPLEDNQKKKLENWIYISSALFVFALIYNIFLRRYHLMYSTWGAVSGPGWTDVHIRLPMYIVAMVIGTLIGIALLIPAFRQKLRFQKSGGDSAEQMRVIRTLAGAGGVLIISWFLLLNIVPALFQWLRVQPNEISLEKPYIKNNIEFTRNGFSLDKIEERDFPAGDTFRQETVTNNQNLFDNIRLWDWRALDAVYKQFQEIRLYYEFDDVDVDRYHFDDQYKQVMVSARELEVDNLPDQSQTFVNKRFKYTHGYGITLNTVSDFTSEGLPNLLVQDIPSKSKYSELDVTTPQLYYGELAHSPVIVNSDEEEFDYPSGEKNVYTRYQGKGGVQLKNIWRKFLFGWKFDGTKFFLSGYPNENSRIMFHRKILDRVHQLAPFLTLDDDPYIFLSKGKLYWMVDAYTTSRYYPYSEPFDSEEKITFREGNQDRVLRTIVAPQLNGSNYIRNSVKIIVDAYEGSVDFFIYDEKDPIVQVWNNIFPDLFKPKSSMPQSMKRHVRYPVDFLLTQGLVYAKYHMSDPAVFYNQEDLWIRATEKYYNQVQPVEPYYVMWELPGSDHPEYVLILPFTPKNRQVLIGWIAGMSDPENYGRFLAYKFPKEKRIIGPQQVETKIDQDSFLSGQLSLWDQRGSNVIRGNVLAIPIDTTIIYVEPIYLQAETAAYPELRLVAVMHNDNLSYAETFEEALTGLFQSDAPEQFVKSKGAVPQQNIQQLIQQANRKFEDYLSNNADKQFQQAAGALEELQNILQELKEQTSEK